MFTAVVILIAKFFSKSYIKNHCQTFFKKKGQYNQNERNAFERSALSGQQKHITKESDGFHNHSTQLTMTRLTGLESIYPGK